MEMLSDVSSILTAFTKQIRQRILTESLMPFVVQYITTDMVLMNKMNRILWISKE